MPLDDEGAKRLEQLAARVDRLEEQLRPPPALTAELPRAAEQLEGRLGTYWLSRLGIVSLISGVALLIVTYFDRLGPFLRIAVGYAVAAAIAWAGWQLARRVTRLFGHVVFGGGLAVGYFVTYALHFVRSMRVIESELAGIVLVALAIVAIVVTAHRLRSETVAGVALFLGLHTGMITDVSALTLVCTSLLALGALFFLAVNRWVIVPLSTVVAVYATHATWAYPWPVRPEGPTLSLSFLALDFVLFSAAALLTPSRSRSLLLLALLNWAGLVALGAAELWELGDAQVFVFLATVAVAQAGLAAIARLRRAAEGLQQLAVALAVVTIAVALPLKLSGGELTAGWAVLGLGAAALARFGRAPPMAVIALNVLGAMLIQTVVEPIPAWAVLLVAAAFFAAERLQHAELHPLLEAAFIGGAALSLLAVADAVLPGGLQTLAWVGGAFLLFVAGFLLHHPGYRWAGFGLLLLAAGRLLLHDLRHLTANERILTFLLAGVALLIVSFVYTRLRKEA